MSYRGFQSTNVDEERNDWSRLSRTLASNVHKISQNVNQIQRLINELQTSEESEYLRTQLHNMQEKTAQLTTDTNSCLKELAELPQLVQSSISIEQNRRNPLINNLNAFNNRKTNFLVDSNNGKQFSVEKFMTPSSLVSKKSNFYEGKTVFGGANSSRAARLAGTTPYNLLQRHHLAPVVRVNVETSKRLVESSEPLSSSSQRILEKLEKASTPLQDARRIPSSAHPKNYFQNSDLLHRTSKRPKLGAIPVLSQTLNEPAPFQPQRWELRLCNKDNLQSSATDSTDQLINSCDNKYLIDSKEIKSNETFGGKIMRKDSRREEKRPNTQILTNNGEDVDLDLLTSAQPLKMPSSLPKFNFVSKPSEKSALTTVITKATEPQDLEFKFSEPLLKTRDQKSDALPTGKNGRKPFVFSSPLSAITQKTETNYSERIENKSKSSEKSILKLEKTIESLSKESTHSDSKEIKTNTETKKNEITAEKWICVCLFQNISSDNKCKACKKERSSQLKTKPLPKTTFESNAIKSAGTTSIGWGNSYKPPSGSWSCSICLVSNPSDKTKCMACEEPKPGDKPLANTMIGWGNSFKQNTNSWSCDVCLVSNPSDKTKCMACEEPKPGTAYSLSIKDSSKNTSEEWQCFYCKHNNEPSKTTCNCGKIKTPIATKADLDKLIGGQTFKFGCIEGKKESKIDVSQTNKSNEGKTDIFKQSINSLSKSCESTPQTTTSNAFVFGSSGEDKNKLLTDSNAFKPNGSTGSVPAFKFGVPTVTSEVKSIEKSNPIADIFGSNKGTNNSFSFGTPTTTETSTPHNNLKESSESTSLFLFGTQNKGDDSLKNKKNVSFELDDKSKGSELITNKSSTDSTFGFQLPKSSEDKPNIFKNFNSSPSGSLFGLTTTSPNTTVTTVTTVSITSFVDNKFTSKQNEPQNKSIATLFGAPTTTNSFSSPFSLTNSYGSGQKSTSITGQTTSTESNDTKSLFSLTPSSSIKSFGSIASSQTKPLSSVNTPSSATPTASLSLSNSSSPPKGLVFGSNPSLPSFSSQSSTATTKPNFSFNLSGNTGSTTATPISDSGFGTSSANNSLFGSNPNKGFTFGNSALNSSQTPAFSFTNTSSNSLSNSSSNLKFPLNANTISTTGADNNNSKPATNSLFSFGGQNSDQFSSPLTQKPLNNNNTNINSKTNSQFSFGLSTNSSTGQTNSSNLFANAINTGQNSLSFNQMAPTAAPTSTPSPFTFGGFGSNQTTPAMPQMQSRPQQPQPPLPPPSFNFATQPSFDFASLPNSGPTASPANVFQFSAEQTSQTVAPNRNIKKAKRRLNPT